MANAKGNDGDDDAQGVNRFDDVFHRHKDDRDAFNDDNTDFTDVYAAVARAEEQQLSQKLSQLSASNEEPVAPSTTAKRTALTPPATTTSATSKRMRTDTVDDVGEPLPNYLSSARKIFDERMTPLLEKSATSINIEHLRQVAHLIHKLVNVELDISLWTSYLNSGTGDWKDEKQGPLANTVSTHRPLLLWPHDVKATMIREGHLPADVNTKTIDHETCLAFAYATLRQYLDERDQYQTQLKEKKQRLNNTLTTEMDEAMVQFVEQYGGVLLRVPVEGQIAIVKYEYADRLMDLEFEAQTPYDAQWNRFKELTRAKNDYVVTKYDVAIAKQRLKYNHLPKSFESVHIPSTLNLTNVTDEHQRQRLKDRCEKIIQRAKSDMMTVHIAIGEAKMNENRVKFDTAIAQMRQVQSSGPQHMKLTSTMMAILTRRFQTIDERMEHIYQLKMRFFVTAPTVAN